MEKTRVEELLHIHTVFDITHGCIHTHNILVEYYALMARGRGKAGYVCVYSSWAVSGPKCIIEFKIAPAVRLGELALLAN